MALAHLPIHPDVVSVAAFLLGVAGAWLLARGGGIAGGILAIAPVSGWLRRTALALAAVSFVGMAMPKAAFGQFAVPLFFVWVLAVSIAPMVRRRGRRVVQHASNLSRDERLRLIVEFTWA